MYKAAHSQRLIITAPRPREKAAADFTLLALCIALHGTRLARDSSGHPKYSKHGEGSQKLINCASEIIKEYSTKMPAGATLNSVSSALPEVGLVSMLADSTKPAASCSQMKIKDEIKAGLLQHTDSLIGGGKVEAATAAKAARMKSDIGSSSNPLCGGQVLAAAIDPFRKLFKEEPTIKRNCALSSAIEQIFVHDVD